MKTVLTFIVILQFGFSASAQDIKEVKVATKTVGVEMNIDLDKSKQFKNNISRLYRYKNSRIKKELNFRTKRNRSKLA